MDYKTKNKNEFNVIKYVDRLLKSDFSILYPEENERLSSLNVYGDNRKKYNNLEGLIFCCMDRGTQRGDFRALACLMQMYNVANQAEIEGNKPYNELMDAIAGVSRANSTTKAEITRKLSVSSSCEEEII